MQSYRMTHVRVHVQGVNRRHNQIPFGRLVEKRMKNVCEARVLLYSNDSVGYQRNLQLQPNVEFAPTDNAPTVYDRQDSKLNSAKRQWKNWLQPEPNSVKRKRVQKPSRNPSKVIWQLPHPKKSTKANPKIQSILLDALYF